MSSTNLRELRELSKSSARETTVETATRTLAYATIEQRFRNANLGPDGKRMSALLEEISESDIPEIKVVHDCIVEGVAKNIRLGGNFSQKPKGVDFRVNTAATSTTNTWMEGQHIDRKIVLDIGADTRSMPDERLVLRLVHEAKHIEDLENGRSFETRGQKIDTETRAIAAELAAYLQLRAIGVIDDGGYNALLDLAQKGRTITEVVTKLAELHVDHPEMGSSQMIAAIS